MGELIISADRDDSTPGVYRYKQETVNGGQHRTERWHIPREFEPSRPLCGARLAGQFKRTKGMPNCGSCMTLASLERVYPYYYPVLRALYLTQPIPPYAVKHADHATLYEADLVGDKGGRMVLTTRDKIAARDIVTPVGWYDATTRLYHARRALALETLCGFRCGYQTTSLKEFERLHADARKHGRTTITCVRCAIHPDHRADVD